MSFDGNAPTAIAHSRTRSRGTYRLMFARDFGPFFWGKVTSATGIWIYNIAAAIVAYEISGAAWIVGLVSAAQFLPQLLLAPVSGKISDRSNGSAQIVAGRWIVGFGSAGLSVWIWAGGGVGGMSSAIPVVASSLIVGFGLVLGGPAMQTVIIAMIRPGELAAAVSLNSASMPIARAAGPLLGAVVAIHFGAASAFALAAVLNFIFGFVVLWMKIPGRDKTEDDDDYSVMSSLRYVRRDPILIALLLGIAAIGFGSEPSVTLAPTLAAELERDMSFVGWLTSAFGVGAGLGFLLFALLHRWVGLARLSTGGLALLGASLLGAAFSQDAVITLCAFGAAGFGMTVALTSLTTRIHERSPDVLRGRIMALWLVGFLGVRPFAAGLNGYLADNFSSRTALIVTSFLVLLSAVFSPRDPERQMAKRLSKTSRRELSGAEMR